MKTFLLGIQERAEELAGDFGQVISSFRISFPTSCWAESGSSDGLKSFDPNSLPGQKQIETYGRGKSCQGPWVKSEAAPRLAAGILAWDCDTCPSPHD